MLGLGRLYGVGVGPGDPELVTLKALRVMREADRVYAAGHERSGKSLAASIVAPHLGKDAEVGVLHFPHTFDSVDGRTPHREAALGVVDELRCGHDVAFLTLGDPMTFSTFTYLLDSVQELLPEVEVTVVPGITSYAAAAAAAVSPLAEGDETMVVVGASRNLDGLGAIIDYADTVVIMKPYRMAGQVRELLEKKGLEDGTTLCVEVSRPSEKIFSGTDAFTEAQKRYMSLFLVKKEKGGAG